MTDRNSLFGGVAAGVASGVRVHSESGSWSIESATPPQDIENPNKGFHAITLTVPKENRTSIEIEIRP